MSTLTQPHKTAYPPPPQPPSFDCRPVLAITDAGIIVYHITEKCFTVATALCVCVCVCVCVWVNAELPTVIYDLISIFSEVLSLSQSIFTDFAVPVCLLLLIGVVLYFICLYIVYHV